MKKTKNFGIGVVVFLLLALVPISAISTGTNTVEPSITVDSKTEANTLQVLGNLNEEQIAKIMESGTEKVIKTEKNVGCTITYRVGTAVVSPQIAPLGGGLIAKLYWSKVEAKSGPFSVWYLMARGLFVSNGVTMIAVYDSSSAWAAWPLYRIDDWSHFKTCDTYYGYVQADAEISGLWWWQHWSPCCWVTGYADGTFKAGYHW